MFARVEAGDDRIDARRAIDDVQRDGSVTRACARRFARGFLAQPVSTLFM
jgi:hypothetical protein